MDINNNGKKQRRQTTIRQKHAHTNYNLQTNARKIKITIRPVEERQSSAYINNYIARTLRNYSHNPRRERSVYERLSAHERNREWISKTSAIVQTLGGLRNPLLVPTALLESISGVLDLCCLLNIVFGLCNRPDILRHNRTVLIPKKGDLSLVVNWKPITIFSLFSRFLHKILASRLYDSVKLHHAQRGFVPSDGIMSSYTISDTIIREHRLKGSQIYVLSIDLTKAFDKIHPKAIEHALIENRQAYHWLYNVNV